MNLGVPPVAGTFLLICATGLIPIALGYGVAPWAWFLSGYSVRLEKH